jgi:membrane protein implicated in regulation of membrane protease activity
MDPALAWLLLGLALIVIELLSGTFYLLILGIAAGIGSLVAWYGTPIWVQTIVVAGAAVLGCGFLQKRKLEYPPKPAENQLDVGQTVAFESWVSEPQRLARVRYRDASWEAEVTSAGALNAGAVLYVVATEGSRLKISTGRPA